MQIASTHAYQQIHTFDFQTTKERTINYVSIFISKSIKLAVAGLISVIFAFSKEHDCGRQAYELLLTLLIVMYCDVGLFAVARLALVVKPGCLPAIYLMFYSAAKWLLRLAIVSCGIVINVHYFSSVYDCGDNLKTSLFAMMIVLDVFTVSYLAFANCLLCSCFCAFSGITNTTVTNERGSVAISRSVIASSQPSLSKV
jgi:hypothetical protein